MATRPYMQKTGDEIIALINAGDKVAITEAHLRSNRKVKAALAALDVAPAKKPAAAKKAPAKRKTGVGSRGGDPVKAGFAATADKVARRATPEWWAAYKLASATYRALQNA